MAKSEYSYSPDDRDLIEKEPIYRVLAERRDHGVETVLKWLRKTNTVWITLTDIKEGVDATFQVPNEEALEAFYHPYAYGHHLGKLASQELVIYEGEDGS